MEAGYKRRTDFARAIGMNPSTLANYEIGAREFSDELLLKFADFFDVSVDYLMGRTEHKLSIGEYNKPFIENDDMRLTIGEIYNRLNELRPENKKLIVGIIDAMKGK